MIAQIKEAYPRLGGEKLGVNFQRKQTGRQLKAWATVLKGNLEPLPFPRVFGYARWRKGRLNKSGEFATEPRPWDTSIKDNVNAIDEAGVYVVTSTNIKELLP